jgi:hypothetical protein
VGPPAGPNPYARPPSMDEGIFFGHDGSLDPDEEGGLKPRDKLEAGRTGRSVRGPATAFAPCQALSGDHRDLGCVRSRANRQVSDKAWTKHTEAFLLAFCGTEDGPAMDPAAGSK